MGKPWAKLEIDFIDHPKFQFLGANAICLWLEGKNYCDKHMTDGLIPAYETKRFRFGGKASIARLLMSAGQKNETGDQYQPLWAVHPVGFKMVGYLEYNDCRAAVLERIEDAADAAELRKLANKDRQIKFRADRKARLKAGTACVEAHVAVTERNALRNAPRNAPVTPVSHTPTEAVSVTEADKKEQGRGAASPPPPRPMAPIHDRSHHKHALCGRVCLHASLFNEFVRRRNHDGADQEIRTWAGEVIDLWTSGVHMAIEPGDAFDFWKSRYAEKWPAAVAAAVSKAPTWAKPRVNAS